MNHPAPPPEASSRSRPPGAQVDRNPMANKGHTASTSAATPRPPEPTKRRFYPPPRSRELDGISSSSNSRSTRAQPHRWSLGARSQEAAGDQVEDGVSSVVDGRNLPSQGAVVLADPVQQDRRPPDAIEARPRMGRERDLGSGSERGAGAWPMGCSWLGACLRRCRSGSGYARTWSSAWQRPLTRLG